jgi:hypothetical protein
MDPDHCVPVFEALGISAADFTVVYVVPREKSSGSSHQHSAVDG